VALKTRAAQHAVAHRSPRWTTTDAERGNYVFPRKARILGVHRVGLRGFAWVGTKREQFVSARGCFAVVGTGGSSRAADNLNRANRRVVPQGHKPGTASRDALPSAGTDASLSSEIPVFGIETGRS